MKSLGFILWFVLPLELFAIISLSPELDSWAHWTVAIAAYALTFWAAVYLSMGKHIHRGIAVVVIGACLSTWNFGRKLWKRMKLKKHLEEIRANIPVRPEIAEKSTQLVHAHPKILRRKNTVVLGYDSSKRPVSIDLSSQHTLVGASTGAGKTNLLNSILIQVFGKRGKLPDIYLIDLKGNREDALFRWGTLATYVSDVEPALELLRDLVVRMAERNRNPSVARTPVYLIIDEVADLTTGTESREYRQSAVRLLTLLARKSRSANIAMVVATQHPRYDVLDKAIANNLMRKVCLAVDTTQQAEVVLGFSPRGSLSLPKRPGAFILKDGLGIKTGMTLRVQRGEVEETLLRHISHFRENELQLWKALALGKRVGDTVPGVDKTYKACKDLGQNYVKFGFRHLAYAGVLTPPKKRGESNRVKVAFLEGIPLIREYVKAGKWVGVPEPFLNMEVT